MKKTSRLLAILLALLMMFALFAGCKDTPEPSGAAATTPAATSPVASAPPVETEPPAYFPLAETETITYWYVYPPFFASFLATPADGQYFKTMEERTNVHVDFELASTETSGELFSIMAAAENYPDLVQQGETFFKGGGDASIEEDAFIRLNELIAEFSPEYVAALDEFDAWKDVTTDGGNIVSFFGMQRNMAGPDQGLAIRKDWLNTINMEVPQTYDELRDVLLAFQSELGVANPMPLMYTGAFDTDSLALGYDTRATSNANRNVYPFFQIDGKVQYGPITDGFKEYLTMLNQWYSESLISPDFTSPTESSRTDEGLIFNDLVGVMVADDTSFSTLAENSGIEGFKVVAMPELTKTRDQQLHMYDIEPVSTMGSVVISKNAADAGKAELICRWLNYNYTDEGSLLFNYGVEGVSFDYVDGKPQLGEALTNNPDGLIFPFAMAVYVQQFGPAVIDVTRGYVSSTADEKAAGAIWLNGSDGAYMYPTVITMTAEEDSEFSRLFSDINTYVSENTVKFIVGTRSLDTWDSYIADIKAMDVDVAIALKEAAYARYAAR